MRLQHLCNEFNPTTPPRPAHHAELSPLVRHVRADRRRLRKSKRKVMLRDCAYDKHPICEGPIVFARIDFRNLSIDGDHIRTTTNIQQDPSEDIDARMFE